MKRKKTPILIILDSILINLSYLLALYIRFDGDIFGNQFMDYFNLYRQNFIYITIIKLLIFSYFNIYKSVWKYASIDELLNIVIAGLVSNGAILSYMFIREIPFPRSIYVISALIDMLLIGGIRFSLRTLSNFTLENGRGKNQKRVLVIGAGQAGNLVIRELKNNMDLNSRAVGIIDDDESKIGQVINGVPVVGNREDIPNMVNKLNIKEIIIAIPSAAKKEIGEIVKVAKTTDARLKILPGIFDIIDNKIDIKNIRDVKIEDLLGREETKLDLENISSYITGKVVMVTGGGGSIGSELCRQVAKFSPKRLIIFEIYENSAYDIQNELLRNHEDLDLKVLIGSIRDKGRIDSIIEEERPEVIFHAAAHKHVPLMEDSPKEAIKNNVFGTLNLAQSADKYGVKRFVMISTDKAVNPTNIMGASKRICEMIIQSINVESKTEFVAVRFGNVLGSNGSVIPLFKKQIEEGGPVCVTHKEVIRYFMTIPEAVQLVMQAGSMAKGGEIFVLDMGEPMKIIDLAKDLIRLSGYEPYVDMEIKIIGLRPGEKLFEELLLDEEGISNTDHDKIFIGQPIFTNYKLLLQGLKGIEGVMKTGSEEDLKDYINIMVPNYNRKEEEVRAN